jgi:serine/threonine-protein kinase HipA
MNPTGIRADVYKAGILAATLTRQTGMTEFRYLEDYLAAGLRPVATTLPLTHESLMLPGGAVPPFFAGLLPEGRRLTALRTRVKASADDELSLLLAVGSDTVGDVQVMPAGEPPLSAPPLLDVPRDLSDFRFADALPAGLIDQVGLPGVQDKVSGRMINVPASQRNKSLIVKLAPPEYPHLIENEAYFLELARNSGIKTVDWRVIEDADGVKALLVTRFDRIKQNKGTARLAFEDATQTLRLWPADKYNVSLEEAATALLAHTAAPVVAARTLFQQVVFAILTGNGDQHAKNLALLATVDGEWRISPAFDLPSTIPYGDDTLALSIQGSVQPFSRTRLLAFAQETGLSRTAAERVIDQLLERTQKPLEELSSAQLPFAPQVLTELKKALAYRHRQLRQ